MHVWTGLDGAEIVAICGLVLGKAMVEGFGVTRVFDDPAQMFAAVGRVWWM